MRSPIRFLARRTASAGSAVNASLPGANKPAGLERVKAWFSPLNLHLFGVGLLVLGNLYLLVHLGIAWSGEHRDNASALEQQGIELKAAEIAARPLRGLDSKLVLAGKDADKFYQDRIPTEDSTVIAELGDLAKKNGVKLTRVQYSDSKPVGSVENQHEIGAEDAGLTEVRMDASLSGDYRPLVQFINGLERDKIFFLIGNVALTGQQSGVVNLRMKLTGYLRQPTAEDLAEKGKKKPVSLDSLSDTQVVVGNGTATQAEHKPSTPRPSGVRP
ncbi:MAG: hypothetical protein ACYCSN_11925 [Acidobacteriaceae bacterium]